MKGLKLPPNGVLIYHADGDGGGDDDDGDGGAVDA